MSELTEAPWFHQAWYRQYQRERRRRAFCLLLLVGSCTFGCLLWLTSRLSAASLERSILTELPEHSSVAAGREWFQRHEIAFHESPHPTGEMRDGLTLPQIAGLRDQVVAKQLDGRLDTTDANRNLMSCDSIRVVLFYDSQDRLIVHFLEEFNYSL